MKWQWRLRTEYTGIEQEWEDFNGAPDIWWLQMEYRQVPNNPLKKTS